MAMNRLAIFPLIDMFEDQNLTHKRHADDGIVACSLKSIRFVLDKLNEYGSAFGYNGTHSKTRVCSDGGKKFFGTGC